MQETKDYAGTHLRRWMETKLKLKNLRKEKERIRSRSGSFVNEI